MKEDIQILKEIEKAAALCEKEYSHEEIIDMMKTEKDFEKQICILKLQKLNSQQEADLLVYQLTGHHGLIREAAALKINEFITNEKYIEFFLNNSSLEAFLKAVNDINPNICRLVCSMLKPLFKNNAKQKQEFLNSLYKRFDEVFEELEKLKRSNWYTKKLFNLYWCLEALAVTKATIDKKLETTLEKSANIKDYTIREKAAMVICSLKLTSPKIEEIKHKLKLDNNFYVKRYAQSF